jgi:hypothetical protein
LAGSKGSGGDGRWKARAGADGAAGEWDAGRIRGVEVRRTGSGGRLIAGGRACRCRTSQKCDVGKKGRRDTRTNKRVAAGRVARGGRAAACRR